MAEMKELSGIYDSYKDKGLQVLAISEDDIKETAKVRQFVKSKKWPFIIVIDKNQDLKEKFSATNVPTLIVVKKGGEIHSVHTGYLPGDEKKLREEIGALFTDTE